MDTIVTIEKAKLDKMTSFIYTKVEDFFIVSKKSSV